MRGFFGIGVQEISKERNLGNLVRSAHSFDASFFFTIGSELNVKTIRSSDTSGAYDHMPFYEYESFEDFKLPKKCALVGVEFVEDSVELPSFKHPLQAAYIMGPEMGELNQDVMDACDHVIKIPMKFCINVGTAGAIVMYDRLISLGKFAARPAKSGGPDIEMSEHIHGLRRISRKKS